MRVIDHHTNTSTKRILRSTKRTFDEEAGIKKIKKEDIIERGFRNLGIINGDKLRDNDFRWVDQYTKPLEPFHPNREKIIRSNMLVNDLDEQAFAWEVRQSQRRIHQTLYGKDKEFTPLIAKLSRLRKTNG